MKNGPAGFDRNTTAWKKSTRSGGSGGNCVEVAQVSDGDWAVRDSKDPDGPILLFGSAGWRMFIDGIKKSDLG
jgi:hypothetical protein